MTVEKSPLPAIDSPMAMTDEQKFIFDLKGWLCVPGVLPKEQIDAIKEHLLELHLSPTSTNVDYLRGPAQELLDHPLVVGILNEVLAAARPAIRNDGYNFRCESSFFSYRELGYGAGPAGVPHGGEPEPWKYSCRNGRIYSGLTRIVWELTEIAEGDASTLVLSGSHKANFALPEAHRTNDSPLFETYTCPPGSLMIFTEDLIHSGPVWNNPDRPRITIFTLYGPVGAQHHKLAIPPDVIEEMPVKRQSLFRGTWMFDPSNGEPNMTYSPQNRAV